MGILKDYRNDLTYFARGLQFLMKSRPSVRNIRDVLKRKLQFGYDRGYNYGLQRAHMYHPGADNGVLRNDWTSTVKSSNTVVREDFKNICARAEYAYRTDAISRRAGLILVDYIVGQGNQPYPSVKMDNGEMVEGVNGQLAKDWERYNDEGMRNGTMHLTMYEGQRLKCLTMIVYGSYLQNVIRSKKGSFLPYSFQILKPTRLDFSKDTYFEDMYKVGGKTIIHGIELNEYGEALQFYLENEKFARDASNIDFVFYPIETEQYLGLSWYTPVLPAIWDRQQLLSDKLKQSRIGARLGMQLPRNMQEGVAGLTETDTAGNEFFDLDYQGFVFSDKDIKPVQITDPLEHTYKVLSEIVLQEIALGFGFSYQKLTSDLQKSNFTSGRINEIGDNKFFRAMFKFFSKSSCQLDWNRFVEWEAFTGRLLRHGVGYSQYLANPWYYNQCYWLPRDGQDWVDPLKDAQALVLLYKTGQITFAELCSRAGKNYRSVIKQLKREREELIEAGLEHQLPENISASARPENTSQQLEENVNEEAE